MLKDIKIENSKPITCKKCGSSNNSFPLGQNGKGKYYYRPTCTKCKNSVGVEHRKKYYSKMKVTNPERYALIQRRHRLKKKYGLTLEKYAEIFNSQGGVCAICRTPESPRNMPVDHNHTTGEIRGILCDHCNKALGYFKDNVETMKTAIAYIQRGGLE